MCAIGPVGVGVVVGAGRVVVCWPPPPWAELVPENGLKTTIATTTSTTSRTTPPMAKTLPRPPPRRSNTSGPCEYHGSFCRRLPSGGNSAPPHGGASGAPAGGCADQPPFWPPGPLGRPPTPVTIWVRSALSGDDPGGSTGRTICVASPLSLGGAWPPRPTCVGSPGALLGVGAC